MQQIESVSVLLCEIAKTVKFYQTNSFLNKMDNSKLNFLYIVFHGIDNYGGGIAKKLLSQVKALNNLGVKTAFSYLNVDVGNNYLGRSVDGKSLETYKKISGKSITWEWRFRFNKLLRYVVDNQINVIYVRYTHFANPFFNRFLKKLKQRRVFIILEVPTYPYDQEYANLKLSQKIIKRTEEIFRTRFKKLVDIVVSYTDEEMIFGIKTIKISNGIEINSIKPRSHSPGNDLHILVVASMEFWHGYDRLIEGLKDYYSGNYTKKVMLHFVGDSDNRESVKYKLLVEMYHLGEFVTFHGFRKGEELDNIFDSADLAAGCLAVHRKGISTAASLKNSEYCARGIPFIYSEIDNSFEGKPFIYKIKPDESNVDINELVNFISSNKFNPSEIRKFAAENLTWEIQMAKILNEIEILKNGQGI